MALLEFRYPNSRVVETRFPLIDELVQRDSKTTGSDQHAQVTDLRICIHSGLDVCPRLFTKDT